MRRRARGRRRDLRAPAAWAVAIALAGSLLGACALPGQARDGVKVSKSGATRVCTPPGARYRAPDGGPPLRHDLAAAPAAQDDGWPVSTLAAEGLARAPIAGMFEAIAAERYTKVDSILIARHGRLVLEAYFNGFSREVVHDTRSSFKSFASTLVGIAVDRGLIADVAQPALALFPDHAAPENLSAHKRAITLQHLLTMTAGFDAEEAYGLGPWRETDMWASRDWVKFALDMPMAGPPGEVFAYNTPTSMLLGGVVARAAGEPVTGFAARELFAPLGIKTYCWTLSPSGQAMTGGSFFMRPRDMAKLGQLFLDEGTWQGRRIVSAGWVAAATRPRVDATGPHDFRHDPPLKGYGYQWWTRRWKPGDARFDGFFASGNGGQKIMVFPALDLVVVFTGSWYSDPRGHRQTRTLLWNHIFPAVDR